jgi:hypothetical protein
LSKSQKSLVVDTSLGEPKAFQAEEDKMLAEDPCREGNQGSKRSFQSKETTLGLGGSVIEECGILPCSEGTKGRETMSFSTKGKII